MPETGVKQRGQGWERSVKIRVQERALKVEREVERGVREGGGKAGGG